MWSGKRGGLAVFPGVGAVGGLLYSAVLSEPEQLEPFAGTTALAPRLLLPLLADFRVDRCMLLATARSSWQGAPT